MEEMASRESQISRAFGDLEHRLDIMKEAFKNIKSRIDTVLRPDVPSPSITGSGTITEKLTSESPTLLTVQIRTFVNQVEKITEDMRNILSRIEL